MFDSNPRPTNSVDVICCFYVILREPSVLTCLLQGGLNIAGEDDAYDFGSGAGFYVDATKEPYNAGYNMYSYITEELPKTVFAAFPNLDAERVSITGHSMGGHGALTLVCFGFFSLRSSRAPIVHREMVFILRKMVLL